MKLIDMADKRFGRLTVLSREQNDSQGSAKWLCRCDCGNAIVASGKNLRNGHTQSCGCLQREQTSKASKTHGMTQIRLYGVWKAIHQRCENPNHKDFKSYGGRGIKMCEGWRSDFKAFYDHVSCLPHFGEKGYSIDRVNNNGNYEPGNVKWSTAIEQRNNQRRVKNHNG